MNYRHTKARARAERVSLSIWPETRSRLNVLKALLSDDRNEVLNLDDVIMYLINHYNAAGATPGAQAASSKVKEYA